MNRDRMLGQDTRNFFEEAERQGIPLVVARRAWRWVQSPHLVSRFYRKRHRRMAGK